MSRRAVFIIVASLLCAVPLLMLGLPRDVVAATCTAPCLSCSDTVGCTMCPAGYEIALAGCQPCRVGYYQASSGNWPCSACPAGFTSALASTSCFACPLNSYSTLPGACLSCAPNGCTSCASTTGGCTTCSAARWLLGTPGLSGTTCVASCPGSMVKDCAASSDYSSCKCMSQCPAGYSAPPNGVCAPLSIPIADAGPDQTVHLGLVAHLDGSHSSDPDAGYPLAYSWSVATKPADSDVALLDAATPTPSFTVDAAGAFTIELVVTDASGLASIADSVTVTTVNSAPTANPGSPQTAHPGVRVTLEGIGSDPDGDRIMAWTWTLAAQPEGSQATLSDTTTASASFTPDVPGDYGVGLVVTDEWGLQSAPAIVTISTTNLPPTADAGGDRSVTDRGQLIQLDGSQSYDPDGDVLGYSWTFASVPLGSNASLAGLETATPSFTADVYGEYIVQLTVSDPWHATGLATTRVSFENLPPVANAGPDQSVSLGAIVHLDGSESSDPNGDVLDYLWSFASTPPTSTAVLESSGPTAQFLVDVQGTYSVQLTVNDGLLSSPPSLVGVTATDSDAEAVARLREAIDMISRLSATDFKNRQMAATLTSKIRVVIAKLEEGQLQDAVDKLAHDILPKLDGCGTEPDSSDWIVQCDSQGSVRRLILDAIAILRGQ